MQNKGVVLVADNDKEVLANIQSALEKDGYTVESFNDGSELIPRAVRMNPAVIIVNPEINAFNEYDICKMLMKEKNVPVILIVEKGSTRRNTIDECTAEDVMIKPLEMSNLVNLVNKHLTVNQ